MKGKTNGQPVISPVSDPCLLSKLALLFEDQQWLIHSMFFLVTETVKNKFSFIYWKADGNNRTTKFAAMFTFHKKNLNYNLYMYVPEICFPGLGLPVEPYKVCFQVLFSLIRALTSIM